MKDICQRAWFIAVESLDTLQGQVESVVNSAQYPSSLIYCLLSIQLIVGEDEIRTDGRSIVEQLLHLIRDLGRQPLLIPWMLVGVSDCVTPQREFPQFRLMKQVKTRRIVPQVEKIPVG